VDGSRFVPTNLSTVGAVRNPMDLMQVRSCVDRGKCQCLDFTSQQAEEPHYFASVRPGEREADFEAATILRWRELRRIRLRPRALGRLVNPFVTFSRLRWLAVELALFR
jgi:hypothetical protein